MQDTSSGMVTFTVFCASHINTLERFECLKAMISSWINQTTRCKLYISISFDTHIQSQSALLASLGEHELLCIFPQSTKLSQFEHYRFLTTRMEEDTYILFTDDDDIWHKDRVFAFTEVYKAIHFESSTNLLSVRIPVYLSSDNKNNKLKVMTTCDIENAIKKGDVALVESDNTAFTEHWTYMVRLSTLCDFVMSCSDVILRHKYCDVLFIKFLRCCKGYQNAVVYTNKKTWMYYYRNCEDVKSVTSCGTVTLSETITKDIALNRKYLRKKKTMKILDVNDIALCLVNMLQLYATKRVSFKYDEFIEFAKSNGGNANVKLAEINRVFVEKMTKTVEIAAMFSSPVYSGVSVFE